MAICFLKEGEWPRLSLTRGVPSQRPQPKGFNGFVFKAAMGSKGVGPTGNKLKNPFKEGGRKKRNSQFIRRR